VTAHALTHAHPDHQGASRDVCERLGIPFWCPEADIPPAEPKPALTPDPERNRESATKLAALEPELVCFGHGAPLRDPDKLKRFVAGLS
jgi:glyoxylase-like metal-dependent hydrolase (beta-lactamase superfamily II)